MSPVAGRTVLITRPAEDAAEWAEPITAQGGRPVVFPCLVTEPLATPETVEALARALTGAQFLAFTSRRGVEAGAALLREPLPDDIHIAAVGPTTAAAARRLFGRVELVAAEETGQGLGQALLRKYAAALYEQPKVAIAAAERGMSSIEEILIPAGIEVARVAVYRTSPSPPQTPPVDLAGLGIDTILLASPSAVTGLMHRAVVPPSAFVVTIGPTTSAAARAAGLTVGAEARRPGLAGLLEVLP